MLSLENQNYVMLLAYRNERDILADNIEGIATVYKESSEDKNQRTSDIILADIHGQVGNRTS